MAKKEEEDQRKEEGAKQENMMEGQHEIGEAIKEMIGNRRIMRFHVR